MNSRKGPTEVKSRTRETAGKLSRKIERSLLWATGGVDEGGAGSIEGTIMDI